jgi:hypothetical protein
MFANSAGRKLAHVVLLLCAVMLAFRLVFTADGSEFMGGRLTGPLLVLCDCGCLGLIAAVLAAYPLPKFSAAIATLAVFLCMPLPLYFVAPGPFRWLFRGDYSVPLQGPFGSDTWSVAALLTFAAVVVICGSNLREWRQIPHSNQHG